MIYRRATESNIMSMKYPSIISMVITTHNKKFEWLRDAINSARNLIHASREQ
jgi:hypothetical protein